MNRRDPRAQEKPPGPASPRGEVRDPNAPSILRTWEGRGQGPPAHDASRDPSNGSASPSRDQMSLACFDKAGLAEFLSLSYRSLDRCAAAGLLPTPDLTIGRSPRWTYETILKWLRTKPRLPGRGRKGAR
jgi:hypothetical protein